MHKPHIVVISGKSPLSDSGGYPAYARNVALALTRNKYRVNILAIGKKSQVVQMPYGKVYIVGTKLVRMFPILQYVALLGLPYFAIIFAKKIRQIIQNSNAPSFVLWGMGPWTFAATLLKHLHMAGKPITVIASYFTSTRHETKGSLDAVRIIDYGLMRHLKYVAIYHIIAPLFNVIELFTLKAANRVVLHYQSSAEIVNTYFHVPKHKITMFPWYAEVFKRNEKQKSSPVTYSHPLVISVGRQDARKGLNYLIRAMKIVIQAYPEANALIVGAGEFLSANSHLVRKLKLTDNVKLAGFVPDVRSVLEQADIAVVVPLAQGSSALTVAEAMSFGKAIVASRCDGIPEDIVHNKTGLLVDKANERQIAEAIIRLLKNPAFRRRLGSNAKKAFNQTLGLDDWQKNITKVIEHMYA